MMMRQQAPRDADIETTDLVPYYRKPPPEPLVDLDETNRRALSNRMADYFKRKAGIS